MFYICLDKCWEKNTYMQTQPDATGCSVDKTESSRCFLMTIPLWFSEAARWRWSPRECPHSPITCVRKLQTDRPPAATTGGSGSATGTKNKTQDTQQKCTQRQHTVGKCFNQIGINLCLCLCVCVVTQPDGAESVASVPSSDATSEKRAAGHHTPNSGTPTISVSRASVSSGISLRF